MFIRQMRLSPDFDFYSFCEVNAQEQLGAAQRLGLGAHSCAVPRSYPSAACCCESTITQHSGWEACFLLQLRCFDNHG